MCNPTRECFSLYPYHVINFRTWTCSDDKAYRSKSKHRTAGVNTSIIAMTLSLFVRRTCITFSQVERKLPSIPLTSIAFTSILVKRKGTYITDSNIWKPEYIKIHKTWGISQYTDIPSQETSPGSLKLQSSLQNQCARSCRCNINLKCKILWN